MIAKLKKTVLLATILVTSILYGGCIAPAIQPSPEPSEPSLPSPTPSPETILPPTPIVVGGISQSEGEIAHSYTWNFQGKEWTLELSVLVELYQYFKDLPRPPTQNYSVYVTHPMDDTYVNQVAEELRQAARKEGFTSLETLAFVAAFVQKLPYTYDSVTTPYDEYPRYPIETLVDNGGDCEDTSILTASLLEAMGYEVVLLLFPGFHAAVGVNVVEEISGSYFEYNGARFFFLETTDSGWELGQIPDEVTGLTASIYGMDPAAIFTHHWDGSMTGNIAKLEVTIENLGPKSAEDVRILTGFDAGDGQLWNAQESDAFALPASNSIVVKLTLQVPQGEHTRIIVQVIYEGYAADESYSEWFDT